MSWTDTLLAAGFAPEEAARRTELLARVAGALSGGAAADRRGYHVPGRIEVLGKHTDYAGGRSLVCATEQGVAAVAAPRGDALMVVRDALSGEERRFEVGPGLEPSPGDWGDYFRAVARRLARDFPGRWRGVEVGFASDLPRAAGVSSSSALLITAWLALGDANDLRDHPRYRAAITAAEALAEYLGAVENGRPFGPFAEGAGVGTLGGSQDQTAILCSRAGRLARVAFDPVRLEGLVGLPPGLVFVIAASGVAAPKTGAALERYNATARRTAELWRLVRDLAPPGRNTLGAALDAGPAAAEAFRRRIDERVADPELRDALLRRLEQLRAECVELVPGTAEALAAGDLDRVGRLVARSQAGAEAGLANQIPETVALVRWALERGAVAASAFGAGFGGSVWALVRRDAAEEFLGSWRDAYLDGFPAHAEASRFAVTRAAPPALRV